MLANQQNLCQQTKPQNGIFNIKKSLARTASFYFLLLFKKCRTNKNSSFLKKFSHQKKNLEMMKKIKVVEEEKNSPT